MLRPMSSSSGEGSSRYRIHTDNEITVADSLDGPSASSSSARAAASSSLPASPSTPSSASAFKSATRVERVKYRANAFFSATWLSKLARGYSRAGGDDEESTRRRMVGAPNDGVFANLAAKPRVEKPFQEELPPPYKSAALDVAPAYYESTIMANGFMDEDDVLVDGLPVGGLFGFIWNMMISMSFQFVGFFLTYLLHTSHSTKNGSKTGLGITFISMGFQMLNGDTEDSDSGYLGNSGKTGPPMQTMSEYVWLSYFLVFLGSLIVIHSVVSFARAKKAEMVLVSASAVASEGAVSASAAAGGASSASGPSGGIQVIPIEGRDAVSALAMVLAQASASGVQWSSLASSSSTASSSGTGAGSSSATAGSSRSASSMV
ncbi:hypothetical protein BGW38_002791 [Lunasporangiospora selenospora]|uniref:Metal homeostatis protein BSD2 n=1 Tax=Lunasporangiospora selenospora TaxID=979761 RepID=A0A9P6FRK3_9FUNG|nr:hypothetical protein BGW38_002791 [Lunasporangiospora selenospora]